MSRPRKPMSGLAEHVLRSHAAGRMNTDDALRASGLGSRTDHLLNLHLGASDLRSQDFLEPPLFPSQVRSTTAVPRVGFSSKWTKDSKYVLRVDISEVNDLKAEIHGDDALGRVRFMHVGESEDILRDPKVKSGEHRIVFMSHDELEDLMDHTVLLGPDGPVLTDPDRKFLCATLMTRELVKARPDLRPEIIAMLNKVEREKTDEMLEKQRVLEAYRKMKAWLAEPLVLQRPDGSALGRLVEAARAGRLRIPLRATHRDLDTEIVLQFKVADQAHSLVVEHDWSGVLSRAEIVGEGGGEVEMPYPLTCFEFVVSGHRVLGLVVAPTERYPYFGMSLLVRLGDDWCFLCNYKIGDDWTARPNVDHPDTPDGLPRLQPLADLVTRNIRAICILLETRIVEREAVRVPSKLNAARVKRGKLPLHDYHVVSLARRERVLPRSPDELDPLRDVTHRRWHLVRAHWRHYANHRTRVPWHSRGNIELGIVDKHYRL